MDRNLIGFQSQMFWVLVLQVQVLTFGVSDVGYKPFILRRSLGCVNSLLIGDCYTEDGGYGKKTPSLPYPSQCGPFLICSCEGATQLLFSSFSEEIVPCVSVDLVCTWEAVSSKSSYINILNSFM